MSGSNQSQRGPTRTNNRVERVQLDEVVNASSGGLRWRSGWGFRLLLRWRSLVVQTGVRIGVSDKRSELLLDALAARMDTIKSEPRWIIKRG